MLIRLFFICIFAAVSQASVAKSCSLSDIRLKHKVFIDEYGRTLDKFKHCTFSCQIQRECGSLKSFSIGLVKEIMDFFGNGAAEVSDLDANLYGLNFGQYTKSLHCDRACALHFPPYDSDEYKSLEWILQGDLLSKLEL